MKGLALAAVLSLAACTGGPQPAATSSSSAAATVTQSSASAPTTLSCRLPVISPTTGSEPPGGWISFPGGQFTRDPASLPGRLESHVPSFDRATGRWVPVEANNVAPDGATYVLHGDPSLPTNGFYLVDARTGVRRLVLSEDGPPQALGSWTVVKYAREGVYLWSTGI